MVEPEPETTAAVLNIYSTVVLNSGYEMPLLGYGTYQTPDSQCMDVVKHALKGGYRHVDSATCYYNEVSTSRGMVMSGVPRSQMFLTSRVYSNALTFFDAESQIKARLNKTGFDYIDLMLIYGPHGGPGGRKAAWKAMVDAQKKGRVLSLGVCNYGMEHLIELESYIKKLESGIFGHGKGGVISVYQGEFTPWLPRTEIVNWCSKRGIAIQASSPLTRGKHLNDPLLEPIMKRTGKSAAQILIRWSLQMGFAPLPKSERPEKIEENAHVFEFELTGEEMEMLDTGKSEPSAFDPTGLPLEE